MGPNPPSRKKRHRMGVKNPLLKKGLLLQKEKHFRVKKRGRRSKAVSFFKKDPGSKEFARGKKGTRKVILGEILKKGRNDSGRHQEQGKKRSFKKKRTQGEAAKQDLDSALGNDR